MFKNKNNINHVGGGKKPMVIIIATGMLLVIIGYFMYQVPSIKQKTSKLFNVSPNSPTEEIKENNDLPLLGGLLVVENMGGGKAGGGIGININKGGDITLEKVNNITEMININFKEIKNNHFRLRAIVRNGNSKMTYSLKFPAYSLKGDSTGRDKEISINIDADSFLTQLSCLQKCAPFLNINKNGKNIKVSKKDYINFIQKKIVRWELLSYYI